MLNKFATICALFGLVSAQLLYDHAKSDVIIYSHLNFEKQVTKNRDKGSSIVHFYKASDAASKDQADDFGKFASDNKGIFRIGSVDCSANQKICDKEGVKTTPVFRLYPPFPAPTADVPLKDGKFDSLEIKKKAARFISDKSIEITANNHKTFIEDNVQTPKVLLFTQSKKGTPFVYKALSQHFDTTLEFGLVRESEDALAQKYRVKQWPSLFVIKAEGKPLQFEGEFSYANIFEFINVHSQIFVDPSAKDNQPKTSAASKPWLTVPVAQMTSDSGNDLCLKKDGTLCVIMVVKNKAALDESKLEVMNSVGQGFTSKISRGIQFNFSWLDSEVDTEFAGMFGLEESALPQLIVLNPGKRKRFLVHEGEINAEGIEKTLDKILGGDARFKAIKGNKLPALVSEYPK